MILDNNTIVNFIHAVWFSETEFAKSGLIKDYCERTKCYSILTKHGYCKLNLSDIIIETNLELSN